MKIQLNEKDICEQALQTMIERNEIGEVFELLVGEIISYAVYLERNGFLYGDEPITAKRVITDITNEAMNTVRQVIEAFDEAEKCLKKYHN